MYNQLVYPDLNIYVTPGWCLKAVQDAFGAPVIEPTATSAWNNAQFKHYDMNFPDGCYVPAWFSLAYEPAGHVVIVAPDKSVYSTSSPVSNKFTHHDSIDALIAYYGDAGLTYLGWTEDIETLKVVGDEMNVQEIQEAIGLLMLATQVGENPGGYASDGQVQYYTNAIMNNPSGGFKELGKDLLKAQANESMRWKAFNEDGGYPFLTRRVAELEAQPAGEFVEAPKMYIKK